MPSKFLKKRAGRDLLRERNVKIQYSAIKVAFQFWAENKTCHYNSVHTTEL